ncbi:hypothetical protein NIES592_17920 [Fischerella major NIES-592]|uniref:Uncharacterized protein n=2 Tax=Fischerella TaxID=1190 RepID=A0A1U7GW03_9CYAN|nr:hypothetical protein NIES592_17920 [Fischerella major NIES-592]PMB43230.1 hypothetical protein CEN41_13400 [Fischerella thermalis CCMEE 5330]
MVCPINFEGYCSWLFCFLLIGIGKVCEKFLGISGWSTQPEFCSKSLLTFPKSVESLKNKHPEI